MQEFHVLLSYLRFSFAHFFSLFSPDSIPPNLQLWEFLLHHLELEKSTDAVKWMRREKGLFRIQNPSKLSTLWGKYRDCPAMTYEKMSRAMRYYYRREILDQTDTRMIYQFTQKVMAQVMEESEVTNRQKDAKVKSGRVTFSRRKTRKQSRNC